MNKLSKTRACLHRALAALVMALLALSPAAYAFELSDTAHVADDIDSSESDPEEFGGFDFSEVGKAQAGASDAVADLSISSSSSGAEKVSAIPKPQPQATGYLKYEERFAPNLFSGSASYTYPFEVPLGANGMEPEIALYYNHHASRSAASAAGVGWAFSTGYIYRDTKSTRSDASDDEFVLQFNGVSEKLVFVPSEGRYHTEHESYLFVEKVRGGDNEFGSYWVVKAKDGTNYSFGYRNDSELASNLENYAVRWSLDRAEDVHGNSIAYDYVESPGSDKGVSYLSGIRYGNSSVSFSYDHSIYSSPEMFTGGSLVRQSGLLKEVAVKHSSELVRKYSLGYQLIEGRPFLTSITETGSDGASQLPPVKFSYNGFDYYFDR